MVTKSQATSTGTKPTRDFSHSGRSRGGILIVGNRPYHGFGSQFTGRQTHLEIECLYGNPMSNNFHKTSLLKNS